MSLLSFNFITKLQRNTPVLLQLCYPASFFARMNASYNQTFKYENLEIKLSPDADKKPDFGSLKFGTVFSEHMFEVKWTEKHGWQQPQIVPMHDLVLHPGAKVLHYAQAVFEGMKAFKHPDGRVMLFRPDMNMNRLYTSSLRAGLPGFCRDELLKCIKKLVSIDKKCVPDGAMSSLYIRPTFIGIEGTLGIAAAKEALLYVVTGATGPYFGATIKPVSLLADPNYVRASPGGVGASKMAANYAPTLYVQNIAKEQKMDQVLWLYGPDHQITEAGGMNVFLVFQKENGEIELTTSPLNGIILPGVVRQTVLDLARNMNKITVSERVTTMKEVITAQKKGRLLEMFATGTAASVCPIERIKFQGENIEIPTAKRENPLYNELYKALTDVQYGKVKSEWCVSLDI